MVNGRADPDLGPLLEEQLDELELICNAGETGGTLTNPDGTPMGYSASFRHVVIWHDRHDRQLLEAARWALANGWTRDVVVPEAVDTGPSLLDRFTDVLKTLFTEDIKNSAAFRESLARTIANEHWMYRDAPCSNEALCLSHSKARVIVYDIKGIVTNTEDRSPGHVQFSMCLQILHSLALKGWVLRSSKYAG
jgi:hypothetical protein